MPRPAVKVASPGPLRQRAQTSRERHASKECCGRLCATRLMIETDWLQIRIVRTTKGFRLGWARLSLTLLCRTASAFALRRHGIGIDAALLPRRIHGEWALIHRPVGFMGAHMWISYSNDLKHWGTHKLMLEARRGAWWDANKIGLCNPPIETPRGWLVIYHGVRHNAAGPIYRLGLALFDLNEPERCLKRGDEWVFGPQEPYEQHGDVGKVVFPCGYTLAPDNDTLRIYYGAADTSIAVATGSVQAMLRWLNEKD